MVELARKEKVFSKVESFLLDFFNEDEINIVENTGKNPDNIWQCIYTPDCIVIKIGVIELISHFTKAILSTCILFHLCYFHFCPLF
jgi:hypothetical protein